MSVPSYSAPKWKGISLDCTILAVAAVQHRFTGSYTCLSIYTDCFTNLTCTNRTKGRIILRSKQPDRNITDAITSIFPFSLCFRTLQIQCYRQALTPSNFLTQRPSRGKHMYERTIVQPYTLYIGPSKTTRDRPLGGAPTASSTTHYVAHQSTGHRTL
jgi:hypothetical protein